MLTEANLKWGHFYDCKDISRKRLKSPTSDGSQAIVVKSGETVQVCATGSKYVPSGVEGTMKVTVVDQRRQGHGGQLVY